MQERYYKVSNLYIAKIVVNYDISMCDMFIGSPLKTYYTILKKGINGKYIDLKNSLIIPSKEKYMDIKIDKSEPLYDYCDQQDKLMEMVTRSQAINMFEKYCEEFEQGRESKRKSFIVKFFNKI